jgi:hypothetical protein
MRKSVCNVCGEPGFADPTWFQMIGAVGCGIVIAAIIGFVVCDWSLTSYDDVQESYRIDAGRNGEGEVSGLGRQSE